MRNINEKALAYIRVISAIIIWIGVLLFHKIDLIINSDSLEKLPEVVTIYIAIALFFKTFLWKIKFFHPWLVPYPYLQGTWEGTLQSTWINPETKEGIPPKKIILVIKQTFSKISCVMFTDESESYSTTAQISEDDGSDIFYLTYNYTNRPKANVQRRSEIHYGATILKIISEPEKKLEGFYWTGRRTTGDFSLKFTSKKLAQEFRS